MSMARIGMPPTIDRTEIAGYRTCDNLWKRSAIPAETCKIQLMHQRGIEFHELIALQTVDDFGRHRARVERFEFSRDPIQSIEGFAVNILVMAFDEAR